MTKSICIYVPALQVSFESVSCMELGLIFILQETGSPQPEKVTSSSQHATKRADHQKAAMSPRSPSRAHQIDLRIHATSFAYHSHRS